MIEEPTNARERRLLHLFMVLNVGLAGALVVLWILSRRSPPSPVTPPPLKPVAESALAPPVSVGKSLATTPGASPARDALPAATNAAPAERVPSASEAMGGAALPTPAVTGRQFTWRDVESPDYPRYIRNLRAVGCPADKVRQIVLADVNRLFDERRLRTALDADFEWWRPQPEYVFTNPLREPGRLLAEQRRQLLVRLLGAEALADDADLPAPWQHVALTGAILGALSLEKHARVQEICGRALERQMELQRAPGPLGQAPSPIEAARSRDQTRQELREVLSEQELEEFLLRYSQIARTLRLELAPANPTAEEFRRIFRALDPLEHQMHIEFGSLQTMSQQQRQRYERQRDAVIREVLGPERFQAYLVSKDPLYQVAQATAQQRLAPPETVLPIYRLIKSSEARRQQILADANLTEEQKRQALETVDIEHAASLQQIVQAASRR